MVCFRKGDFKKESPIMRKTNVERSLPKVKELIWKNKLF